MGDDPEDRKQPNEAQAAYGVLALSISGMLTWGGVGWLIDRWLGTNAFLPIGILAGTVASLYLVIKRYG